MSAYLTFLTGASRGMGLAMAEQLIAAGHDLVCISRQSSDALDRQAAAKGTRCEQWSMDLSQPADVALRLETWLGSFNASALQAVSLINNAGMLARIAPTAALASEEIAKALRLDLEAPMLLTAAFLRGTQAWTAQRKVLNISSGLGRRPMASQSTYCAAKAGMDHFTRCVALEEALMPNGAKLSSLAPGVIDTDMQVNLRTADAAQFPDVGNFVGLKAQGQLASPHDAAARVLAYLARDSFGSQPVSDIRD